MGFLLFAARKLQLKRQINQLSYRQIQLSQEQQRITDQIAQQQQKQQQIQNIFNTVGTMINGAQSVNQAMQLKTLNDKELSKAEISAAYQTMMNGNKEFQGMTYATNVMNSVFTAQNNVQLSQLQNKDNEISMELESVDSKLKLLQAEYENVKKGEQSEAQNSAPTFGLA